MTKITPNLDRLFGKYPQSILERTLIAEYLLAGGYLISDLELLPLWVANQLIIEARRFAEQRMVETNAKDDYHWDFRPSINLN